jgi:hypothetical protein
MTKWACLCPSDEGTGMRVVFPVECESTTDSEPEPPAAFALATDSACDCASAIEPESIPILDPAKGWAYERDQQAEAEGSFIASLYEGRPFQKGLQLHREFLERKAERELHHDRHDLAEVGKET